MDRHSSSSPGTPALYGHACANCAQSKCKCILRRAGGRCERLAAPSPRPYIATDVVRCHRLNKECRPSETVRRRNAKRPAVSKTARLEEKLDGLVSLLQAGAPSGAVIASPPTTSSGEFTPYDAIQMNASTPTYNQSERDSVSSSSNDYIRNAMPATTDCTGSSYEPSPADAGECLLNFQTYKSKFFPFVTIPSTTTAQQLRYERPFLWLCIMTVGSKSMSQQKILGKIVRQTIAQEMVVESAKNIDFLLGLLAFIGWYAIFKRQIKS
jgi:hypothetical protein